MPPNDSQSQPQAEAPTAEETSNQAAPEAQPEVEQEGNFFEPDFSDLVTDSADEEVAEGEAEIEAAAPEETSEEVSEPAEAEASEEEDQPEQEAAPAEETPAETEAESEKQEEPKKEAEPEPEEPEVKLPTREELEGLYEEFRKETMPSLEKLYEMDEETVSAFEDNPTKVLSQLAARTHFDVMMSTYNAVMAAMPSVVGRVFAASNQANEAEGAFFDAWPALKKASPRVVRTAVQAYRSANPKASLEDVIKGAGPLAMMQAGISLDPPKAEEKPKPKAKAPAKPAAPGGVAPTPPKAPSGEEENEFSQLAKDWDFSQFS